MINKNTTAKKDKSTILWTKVFITLKGISVYIFKKLLILNK